MAHELPCPVCEDPKSWGEPCDKCWDERIVLTEDE